MKVRIDSIVIGERARKEVGCLDPLERSLESVGQLQAIGITTDNVLVFGERRLRAAKRIGWTEIEARIVDCDSLMAERDENQIRKDFTPTESVAIAMAIQGRMVGRVGNPSLKANSGNISGIERGDSRDIAARAAGLGSGKTLEAARRVIEHGTPELIEAMDARAVSIHGADKLAKLPAEEQREAVKAKREGRKPAAAAPPPNKPVRSRAGRDLCLTLRIKGADDGARQLRAALTKHAPDVLAAIDDRIKHAEARAAAAEAEAADLRARLDALLAKGTDQ